MNLTRVLQFALQQRWALEPTFYGRMFNVLMRHAEGAKLTDEEITAAIGDDKGFRKRSSEMTKDRGVATIPIHGVIAHRASSVGRVSSDVGTSVEHIRRDLNEALAADDVQAILLDVDSPGGSVAGLDELAAEIRAAREKKPIVAHTDGVMASAAYYLASQADKVFATKSAMVGSIGVIASFVDDHRWMADKGLDPVVIKSTPAKGGMQSNGTFSDADRADVQREVDAYHAMFVDAVAAGRRIDVEQAKAMGDGRVYTGADAVPRGYVDGLMSTASAVRAARTEARVRAAVAGDAAAHEPPDESTEPDGIVAAGAEPQENEMTTKIEDAGKGAATTAQTEAATAAANAEGQKAERARTAGILQACSAEQRDLANKLIADGAPLTEALQAINADLQTRLVGAKALPSGSTASLAAGNTAQVAGGDRAGAEKARLAAMPEGKEKWKAEFEASPDLQAEFLGDPTLYYGWKRNEQLLAINKGEN